MTLATKRGSEQIDLRNLPIAPLSGGALGLAEDARTYRSKRTTPYMSAPCTCPDRLEFAPGVCFKCGRELRPLGRDTVRALRARENLVGLEMAIQKRTLKRNLRIEEETCCKNVRELLASTYWLRDAIRAQWMPE
jgi:hypothetical protein